MSHTLKQADAALTMGRRLRAFQKALGVVAADASYLEDGGADMDVAEGLDDICRRVALAIEDCDATVEAHFGPKYPAQPVINMIPDEPNIAAYFRRKTA